MTRQISPSTEQRNELQRNRVSAHLLENYGRMVRKMLTGQKGVGGRNLGAAPAVSSAGRKGEDAFVVLTMSLRNWSGGTLDAAVRQACTFNQVKHVDLVMLEWDVADHHLAGDLFREIEGLIRLRKVHAVGAAAPGALSLVSREPLPLVLWQNQFDARAFLVDIRDYLENCGSLINIFGDQFNERFLHDSDLIAMSRAKGLSCAQLCMCEKLKGRKVVSMETSELSPAGISIMQRFMNRLSVWEGREVNQILSRHHPKCPPDSGSLDLSKWTVHWQQRNIREQLELIYYWDAA